MSTLIFLTTWLHVGEHVWNLPPNKVFSCSHKDYTHHMIMMRVERGGYIRVKERVREGGCQFSARFVRENVLLLASSYLQWGTLEFNSEGKIFNFYMLPQFWKWKFLCMIWWMMMKAILQNKLHLSLKYHIFDHYHFSGSFHIISPGW